MITSVVAFLVLLGSSAAHEPHAQSPIAVGPHERIWYNSLPGDGGTQVSIPFLVISLYQGKN